MPLDSCTLLTATKDGNNSQQLVPCSVLTSQGHEDSFIFAIVSKSSGSKGFFLNVRWSESLVSSFTYSQFISPFTGEIAQSLIVRLVLLSQPPLRGTYDGALPRCLQEAVHAKKRHLTTLKLN